MGRTDQTVFRTESSTMEAATIAAAMAMATTGKRDGDDHLNDVSPSRIDEAATTKRKRGEDDLSSLSKRQKTLIVNLNNNYGELIWRTEAFKEPTEGCVYVEWGWRYTVISVKKVGDCYHCEAECEHLCTTNDVVLRVTIWKVHCVDESGRVVNSTWRFSHYHPVSGEIVYVEKKMYIVDCFKDNERAEFDVYVTPAPPRGSDGPVLEYKPGTNCMWAYLNGECFGTVPPPGEWALCETAREYVLPLYTQLPNRRVCTPGICKKDDISGSNLFCTTAPSCAKLTFEMPGVEDASFSTPLPYAPQCGQVYTFAGKQYEVDSVSFDGYDGIEVAYNVHLSPYIKN